MEEIKLNTILDTLSLDDIHISKEWLMKNILGIDPVIIERKKKINKILKRIK
jgi:hypothetical protein